MEVWFQVHSYDVYGGHRSLSLIGHWLQESDSARLVDLKDVEFEANFVHLGPPKKTLEKLFEGFHADLSALPLVTYGAKKGKLRLRYRSSIGDARAILKNRDLSIDIFLAAFDELLAVIRTAPIERKKGLNHSAFRHWISEARSSAPATQDELEDFEDWYKAEAQRRRALLSPWEQLDVDWEDYHPAARELLDDPFFWDSCDEYAPHGNDTGADLLDVVRKAPLAAADPKSFLRRVFDGWGMSASVDRALQKGRRDLTEEEETALYVWNQAVVALAFGLLKVRGSAPREAIELAVDVLTNEQKAESISAERAAAIHKLASKLSQVRRT